MRLIPVHTGNTRHLGFRSTAGQAHPRAYGEYLWRRACVKSAVGSSPCIRGIPWTLFHSGDL